MMSNVSDWIKGEGRYAPKPVPPPPQPDPLLAEIKRRLLAGEVVFVEYNNEAGCLLSGWPYEINVLKLEPCGENGLYRRYWRSKDNAEWVNMDSDSINDPDKMNRGVHIRLLASEEEALRLAEKMAQDGWTTKSA